MTKIALLTREPSEGRNNWVFVAQDENDGVSTRAIVWGTGRGKVRGTTVLEADDSFESYVENRKENGYVEQVSVNVYFPLAKIAAFIVKITPKLIQIAEKIQVKV